MKMNFVKKFAAVAFSATASLFAQADTADVPTVTEAAAKQRYPWNGLVDINCKVSGIDGTTNGLELALSAVMPESGKRRMLRRIWLVQNGSNSTDLEVHTNGDYRLLWDARAQLGTVRYTNMVLRVTLLTRGKVQLWEGGPYWAMKNIGAEEPWDYGYYFWWGDTVGYERENNKWVASDGSSSSFSFSESHAPTCHKSTSTLQSEGWITADGVLAPEHDAAQAHWAGNWRMPTETELENLNSMCTWTWTTTNGVNGYIVRGKDAYASASIFLPAAGYGNGTSLYDAGSDGYYWSSVPRSVDSRAWYLYFDSGSHRVGYNFRDLGQSVRAVQGFAE